MASLALLDSKPYYAYTMLGYGKDTGAISFKSNHQTRLRAYRGGHYFHPARKLDSNKIVNSLTDDIFQSVIISFIILSDSSLKSLYDKFGTLELTSFLKSLGVDCQISLMAFCRGVWFSCFENNENMKEKGNKSLLDINNVAQCALSKLTFTSMNYPLKETYSEQELMNDNLMADVYKHLNTDDSANHPSATFPAEFVMIPSLFGITALYSVRLHTDPFSTFNFYQDYIFMSCNPFKRSFSHSSMDGSEESESDNDTFMNDEPSTKRLKNDLNS